MPISSGLSLGSLSSESISDRAVRLISSIKSTFERRNAVRYKFDRVLEHKFETKLLKEPTCCSQCSDLIFGLVGQSCKSCKLVSHKKCLDSIDGKCVVAAGGEDKEDKNASKSHKFKEHNYMFPTCCNHCGILLKGIYKQGLRCQSELGGCDMDVHRECEKLVCCNCDDRKRKRKKLSIRRDHEPSLEPSATTQRENWSRVRIEDFELISLLGTGTFSKVYLGKLKTNGQEFAIKVMKKTNLIVSSDPESALTEKRVLHFGRRYPFLTIAHCCFQSRDRLYFVMEHVVGRDLVYHIGKADKFTEERARFYAAEIVLALRYLHRQGVVHRDLKLDNVILDQHGHCKLLDFGMSKELCKMPDMKTRTFCGTPSYISPEAINDQYYGFSVDWWALGVLMYEMLIGFSPFEAETEEDLYKTIADDEPTFPQFLSDEARCLLEGLLTKDPQLRLGCNIMEGCDQAILEHPFFLFRTSDGTIVHQWDAIEAKRVKPPYRPSPRELELGDGCQDNPLSLSPISENELEKISQAGFDGFSFYSESFNPLLS